MLGQKLLEGKCEFAEPWNFGPEIQESFTVEYIVNHLQKYWKKIKCNLATESSDLHEANVLKLDCSKAFQKLGWRPIWNVAKTLEMTANWYKRFYEQQEVITVQQLAEYVKTAQKNSEWAKL